jgi:hypothetical protein
LLTSKETPLGLIPVGTPSPDSAHLIITFPNGASRSSDMPHLSFASQKLMANEEKVRLAE